MQSTEVHYALYGCTWYDRSESIKRTMLQVIVRAQRPVSLTAGKLYIVSMETFARVSRHRQKRAQAQQWILHEMFSCTDNSLTQPGRKQARKHVRDVRDFNNIETGVVIKLFSLQGKAPKEIHAILTEILACVLPVR